MCDVRMKRDTSWNKGARLVKQGGDFSCWGLALEQNVKESQLALTVALPYSLVHLHMVSEKTTSLQVSTRLGPSSFVNPRLDWCLCDRRIAVKSICPCYFIYATISSQV